jgi:hypothetical protein
MILREFLQIQGNLRSFGQWLGQHSFLASSLGGGSHSQWNKLLFVLNINKFHSHGISSSSFQLARSALIFQVQSGASVLERANLDGFGVLWTSGIQLKSLIVSDTETRITRDHCLKETTGSGDEIHRIAIRLRKRRREIIRSSKIILIEDKNHSQFQSKHGMAHEYYLGKTY